MKQIPKSHTCTELLELLREYRMLEVNILFVYYCTGSSLDVEISKNEAPYIGLILYFVDTAN